MKKKKRIPEKKNRIRTKSIYDTMHFEVEDLLELDEEEAFRREDADEIEDEPEEEEPEEEPIEDLAESPDAEDYDRPGTEESLSEEPEKPILSGEEEDLLTDEQVRDFTQKFDRLPEDISDLEAEEPEPEPEEYDAYDEYDGYEEDDDEEPDREVENLPHPAKSPSRTGRREAPHRGTRRGRNHRAGHARPSGKHRHEETENRKKRTKLSPAEWLAIGMSAVLVIAAVSMGVYFVRMQQKNAQLAAFQEIGADLAGVRIIGESGLIAMRDEAAVRLAEAEEPEEPEIVIEEEEVEQPEVLAGITEINMTLTSIKGDLKIKFVNAQTGKLVASVPFEVTAKAPDGSTQTWQDDDMDGIIYRKDIAAGVWSVTMSELDEKYAEMYTVKTGPQTAKVKDAIEYKKVDVKDEIKKESEVNVAAEDTQPKEAAAVESVNEDTVEWVESSKEEIDTGDGKYTYEEIPKTDLATPNKSVALNRSGSRGVGRMMSNPEEGASDASSGAGNSGEGTEEGTGASTGATGSSGEAASDTSSSEGGASTAETGNTEESGAAGSTQGSTSGTAGSTAESSAVASTASSASGAAGSTTGASAGNASATAASTAKTKKVALSQESLSLVTGNTVTLKVTTENLSNNTVKYTSSDTSIATVTDGGEVRVLKPGTVTITVAAAEDANVKATCTITVSNGGTLKTKNGEVVYIKEGDSFREATEADLATAKTFYKKVSAKKYIYHGWQTIDGLTYYYDKNGNYVTGEQTILGIKYKFSSEGVLASGSGELGVDVSKWNGSINWTAVKNSGVSYAIIRCGYRGTSTGALIEDPTFRTNMKGALNAGLKVGVYFFSAAVNDVEAVEEASMVASLCSGYKLTYPVFLDVERSSSGGGRADNLSVADRTTVIRAFCATMANSGYRTGVYSNKNWFEGMIDTPSLTGYKIWLAQYAAAPTYRRTRYDMWQYTSKGTIGGISGKVDLNISYLNY